MAARKTGRMKQKSYKVITEECTKTLQKNKEGKKMQTKARNECREKIERKKSGRE